MRQITSNFNLWGTLLLVGLFGALVAVLSTLAERAVPGWRPGYLTAACVLVAFEASLVQYRMRRGAHLEVGALSYLAAELFALVVLMRAVASLSLTREPFADSVASWVRAPLLALDGPFVACLCVGAAVALGVRSGLRSLAQLEPRPIVMPEGAIDADHLRAQAEAHEREALAHIGSGVTWGGALMLLALVGQVVNLEQFGGPPRSLPAISALAGVVYLCCGMLLYSRGRLGLLEARWTREGAEVEPAVLRGWRRSSTALVLGVAAIAVLLPRSYGLGLLDFSRSGALVLLNLIALAAVALGVVAIGALSLLVTIPLLLIFLLSSLGGGEASPAAPLELPQLPPEQPPPVPGEPPVLPGLIFWACMAILAGYALLVVLRRQSWAQAAWEQLRAGWLGQFWARLRDNWRRAAARSWGSARAERLPAPPDTSAAPRRGLLRLGRLSPGELIRYFYLSILQRASRAGLGRDPTTTPREYGDQLRQQLPQAGDDIDRLTEAYVRAAYAPRHPDSAEARAARGPWQRLSRALRRRERRAAPEGDVAAEASVESAGAASEES